MLRMVLALLVFSLVSCGKKEGPAFRGDFGDSYWAQDYLSLTALPRLVTPSVNVVWSTGSHTAQPVVVGSIGPEKYTRRLSGMGPNTRIAPVIKQALAEGVSVVLVIGDGMGLSHLALPVQYRMAAGIADATGVEAWLKAGTLGLAVNNPAGELVTCSAAAGTAIANGEKTLNMMLGLDSSGYPLESVLEFAEKRGMATGLMTDKPITDATPAAFYAEVESRKSEADIAKQLADYGEIEIVFGGGANQFIPAGQKVGNHPDLKGLKTGAESGSKRKDSLDLIAAMKGKGYAVVADRTALAASGGPKILGLFAGSLMNAAIDRDVEETGEPSLAEMAGKALAVLSAAPKGFFLMLESGRIDTEAHRNEPAALLQAMLETDRLIKACLAFRKGREKKILFILTADHETGGFGISYSYGSTPPARTLASGAVWQSLGNGVSPDIFKTLARQERSFQLILKESQTPEALVEQVARYTPFTLSLADAKRVIRLRDHEVREAERIKGKGF